MKISTIGKTIPGILPGTGLATLACSGAIAQNRPDITVAVNELASSLDAGETPGNADIRI